MDRPTDGSIYRYPGNPPFPSIAPCISNHKRCRGFSVHENGVGDCHDSLLLLDRCSEPLRNAEQTTVGYPVVEAQFPRDSCLDIRVRCRRFLPPVILPRPRRKPRECGVCARSVGSSSSSEKT